MCEHCEKLPNYKGCYVCGKDNKKGFQLDFYYDTKKEYVETSVFLSEEYIGFTKIIHGGVISTLLDETSAWIAIRTMKEICVTSKLNIEFLLPALAEHLYTVKAYKPEIKDNRLYINSELIDDKGNIIAKGNAEFIVMKGNRAKRMMATIKL